MVRKQRNRKIDSMRLRIKYSEYLRELGITEQRTENIPVDALVVGSDEVFNCLQTNPAVGYSKTVIRRILSSKIKVVSYAAKCWIYYSRRT